MQNQLEAKRSHEITGDEGRNVPSDSIKIARTLADYAHMIAIRSAVFVSEQECPYEEEFDGNDLCSTHLIGYRGGFEPIACLRIRYFADFAKIERMAVRHEHRGSPMSSDLVWAAIALIRKKGYRRIYGQSQDRLLGFWMRFGFQPVSKRVDLIFSDFSYTEIVLSVEADPTAITMESDPYVIIRPEGAWDDVGVLEASATRPVTSPLQKSLSERRTA